MSMQMTQCWHATHTQKIAKCCKMYTIFKKLVTNLKCCKILSTFCQQFQLSTLVEAAVVDSPVWEEGNEEIGCWGEGSKWFIQQWHCRKWKSCWLWSLLDCWPWSNTGGNWGPSMLVISWLLWTSIPCRQHCWWALGAIAMVCCPLVSTGRPLRQPCNWCECYIFEGMDADVVVSCEPGCPDKDFWWPQEMPQEQEFLEVSSYRLQE